MVEMRTALRGTAWLFYAVFVLEILFMISPAALHFYALYGPALRVLERSPATAWLTQFFLPHLSTTADPVLNLLPPLGGLLLAIGTLFFLAAAIPLYWAKIRRRGEVTGGLYRHIRHPQYVGLAIMGLGVLLIWPRFLVLVTFIVMLGLYRVLAGTEEAQCLARFGDGYRAYMARTGRFVPRALQDRLPRILPAAGAGRIVAGIGMFCAVLGLALAAAFALRGYALSQVAAIYRPDQAILSPARLTDQELEAAYRLALADARVRAALDAAPPGKRLVYVVPEDWYLPDLPIEARPPEHAAPHGSPSFDRNRLKLLFATARSHDPAASGRGIVASAYGLDPIIVAHVELNPGAVTEVAAPPAHVYWGDIPTPTF